MNHRKQNDEEVTLAERACEWALAVGASVFMAAIVYLVMLGVGQLLGISQK